MLPPYVCKLCSNPKSYKTWLGFKKHFYNNHAPNPWNGSDNFHCPCGYSTWFLADLTKHMNGFEDMREHLTMATLKEM